MWIQSSWYRTCRSGRTITRPAWIGSTRILKSHFSVSRAVATFRVGLHACTHARTHVVVGVFETKSKFCVPPRCWLIEWLLRLCSQSIHRMVEYVSTPKWFIEWFFKPLFPVDSPNGWIHLCFYSIHQMVDYVSARGWFIIGWLRLCSWFIHQMVDRTSAPSGFIK